MAVVAFEPTARAAYAQGREFGASGAYERIEGRLHFAVDPEHEANAGIVDLELAPRDDTGRVRFSSDLLLLAPTDPTRGNGALLLDVPNRGRALTTAVFNRPGAAALLASALAPGDGFVFERGYSVGRQSGLRPRSH